MLDSNISRGHGRRSSPSTLRSAGAREVRVTTHANEIHSKNEHARTTPLKWQEPFTTGTGQGAEGARTVTNQLSGCVDTCGPSRAPVRATLPTSPTTLTCHASATRSQRDEAGISKSGRESLRFQHPVFSILVSKGGNESDFASAS